MSQPTVREQFLARRDDPNTEDEVVADTVISSGPFGVKLELALKTRLNRHYRNEDLRSDVILGACRSVKSYLARTRGRDYVDLGEESFGGWLYMLCKRHVEWALPRAVACQQRSAPSPDYELVAANPAPAVVSETEYAEAQEQVALAIDRLPSMWRAVLLHDFAGLSIKESARALGLTEPTVKTIRSRARKVVKSLIDLSC